MATNEEIQTLLTAHSESQESRRAIEIEMAQIDGELKSAVSLGDAEKVITLSRRKRELPQLLVEGSGVEAARAIAYYRAQKERTYELVNEAQDELTAVEEAFFKRKGEVEKELAEMEIGVKKAQHKLGVITTEHNSWTYQYDNASNGYHRALAKASQAL
ncbi:MAG TPA: hypothetical protein VIC84_23690 [Blastocatellia bacterium]|jgi:hypothetical protein